MCQFLFLFQSALGPKEMGISNLASFLDVSVSVSLQDQAVLELERWTNNSGLVHFGPASCALQIHPALRYLWAAAYRAPKNEPNNTRMALPKPLPDEIENLVAIIQDFKMALLGFKPLLSDGAGEGLRGSFLPPSLWC
jgi:hypothetical protein